MAPVAKRNGYSCHAYGKRAGTRKGEHVRRMASVSGLAQHEQADGIQFHHNLYYDVHASQIASRADVASAPSYKAQGPVDAAFSSFVPFTHFRPAFTAYPKLSTEIQEITGELMTGQETPAQGAAAYNKYLIATVGAKNVEAAPA